MTITKKQAAAIVIAAYLKKKNKLKAKNKRKWVRDWIKQREIEDTAQKLIQELRNERQFRQFFRMTEDQFDILLQRVGPSITKRDTHMRKAITAETRLLITLRYLSTGDSYRSLMLLFRVAHNTISTIVSSTCNAIFNALKDDYMKVK